MYVCVLYLSAVVVLCHTVVLVDEEGVEDVKMEERGPSCQHQSVLSNIQYQRARRWLSRRYITRSQDNISHHITSYEAYIKHLV